MPSVSLNCRVFRLRLLTIYPKAKLKEKKKQRSQEESSAPAPATNTGDGGGQGPKAAAEVTNTVEEEAEELWARFCKVRGDLVTPLELDFPWITAGSLARVEGFGAHTAMKLVGFIKGALLLALRALFCSALLYFALLCVCLDCWHKPHCKQRDNMNRRQSQCG